MKITRIIMNTIATIVVAAFILLAALNFFSAPSSSGLFGYKGYTVVSGSMVPTFNVGDFTIDRVVDTNTLKKGDVISFTNDQTIVTHRIIEITDEGFVTQGDANNIEDQKVVKPENVIAKYLFAIPKLGFLIAWLQKPIVYALVVGVIGIILLWMYFSPRKD